MTQSQMIEFAGRSQPKPVALIVPAVATAFFCYVALTAFVPGLPVLPVGRYTRGAPPPFALGVLFLALAAVSLAATVWQIRRRLKPKLDIVADKDGIAVNQVPWARGRLAWREITDVEFKYQSSLYIVGKPKSADGKVKKLVLNHAQIDAPIADLIQVIARYRPDLVPMR